MAGNWGMVGHEWAVDLLRQHIQQGEVRHAYLVCGPAGTGRRTLALRFIQALNCTNPPSPGNPCLTCKTCQQVDKMQFADLDVFQPITKGGNFKIGQLRESGIQYKVSLKPFYGRYHTALFLDFQSATDETQNALLKTLEEAPAQSIFILTAETPEQLLPTIVSRCEVMRLRPETVEHVRSLLIDRGAEPGQAELLASLSEGRVGSALSLFQSKDLAEILEDRHQYIDDIMNLLSASRLGRFNYAEKLSRSPKAQRKNKKDNLTELTGTNPDEEEQNPRDKTQNKVRDVVRQVMQLWTTWWRDVYFTSIRASLPPVNIDRMEQVHFLADRLGSARALLLTEKMNHALDQLDRNVNIRLLLEDVLLDWPMIKIDGK